jgi:hypothetical protein
MEPGEAGRDDCTVGTTEDDSHQATVTTTTSTTTATPRKRQGSISSQSTHGGDTKETIRMPPSLTLSKIRSVKQQALLAAVKAKLEISTVALAIVYFERLCLDCRVDKTNRRLSFAACLLLAIKINEAQVGLVMRTSTTQEPTSSRNTTTSRIQSLIRPTKKSSTMFASLLEFFTQDWNISLKHLFAAEWGVFAALQFRLHAKPSHVAFHFKRLLKSLDKNPRSYLGAEVFGYWQHALAREEYLRKERESRREVRQQKKEQKKILQLQRELEAANRREKSSGTNRSCKKLDSDDPNDLSPKDHDPQKSPKRRERRDLAATAFSPKLPKRQGSRISGILNRFSGGKRALSTDKLLLQHQNATEGEGNQARLLLSPSMPAISQTFEKEIVEDFVINIHDGLNDGSGHDGSVAYSDDGGIII